MFPFSDALRPATPHTRHMSHETVAIRQFDPIKPAAHGLDYETFNFDTVFAGHVKISGSDFG